MRSNTNTGVRGRVPFLLIACERSSEYKPKKIDLVKTCTDTRKCGCPFKLRAKPILGGEGWMVKLICGVHNHEIAKSLVGHPYVGRLSKVKKIVVADMMKSMWFRGLFMRVDALPGVIVTDRDFSLMNAVKTVFPDAMNLLCRFHIEKNVKVKCKTLVAQKNAWDYVMEAWGSLVNCPCESSFDEYVKKIEMDCSSWPIFVDYVCQTWVIPHKEKFVKAWTNKVMHLGNTTTKRVESAHWPLKRLLQKSVGDICSRLSFSDQGLCEAEVTITEEMETISKRFKQLDVCGKIHLKTKLREITYPDLNSVCPPPEKVKTKGATKNPQTKQQNSTKHDSSYWEYVDALHFVQNSNSSVKRTASSSVQPIQRQNIPMLNQFHSCIQDSIENIIDVKADGNCGYRAIDALLDIGEESWSLMHNHLHKELTSWLEEYINLLGVIERFEELKRSLLVEELSMWMNITDMGYVIASRYNVIAVSLSRQQSMTIFPLRSQPPPDSSVHHVICISHVCENYFAQVFLRDHCPLPSLALLWNTHCHYQAKQWLTPIHR
ncbi:uncharacterized protein [Glycine max]|uniref:uncharacterized protein n=1 Tax=Glycine max TaxID=3847 RepID=UPI0003DEB3DB|nr:uncharacterized protein LOC102667629 [Glycine max]|eukprot:XP_006586499.1 uncharacterized protein LOC102667629 [Glycine max]